LQELSGIILSDFSPFHAEKSQEQLRNFLKKFSDAFFISGIWTAAFDSGYPVQVEETHAQLTPLTSSPVRSFAGWRFLLRRCL
jgi:hypothetical protein